MLNKLRFHSLQPLAHSFPLSPTRPPPSLQPPLPLRSAPAPTTPARPGQRHCPGPGSVSGRAPGGPGRAQKPGGGRLERGQRGLGGEMQVVRVINAESI